MILYQLFFIDVILPICAAFIFYKWVKKLLWCVPVMTLIVMGSIFLRGLNLSNKEDIISRIKVYFTQDSGMAFTLIIVPTVIMSFTSTLFFYLYDFIKNHHSKKKR